jgi:hypothetical protein
METIGFVVGLLECLVLLLSVPLFPGKITTKPLGQDGTPAASMRQVMTKIDAERRASVECSDCP